LKADQAHPFLEQPAEPLPASGVRRRVQLYAGSGRLRWPSIDIVKGVWKFPFTLLKPSPTSTSGLSPEISYRFSIYSSLSDAEAIWREAETWMIGSPYQRFDWIKAWMDTAGRSPSTDSRPLVIVAFAPNERPIAVLPLVRRTQNGMVVAEFPGGKHANANVGLASPQFLKTRASTRFVDELKLLCEHEHVDLLRLVNVPAVWCGHPTLLGSGPGQLSPSRLHSAHVDAGFPAWSRRTLSTRRKKKLRQKAKKLSGIGPVRLVKAHSIDETRRILEAFYHQKGMRCAQLGLQNPFEAAEIRDFLEEATKIRSPSHSPAIELFGLEVGGALVATLGTTSLAKCTSTMFLSFDSSSPASRFGPGEYLLWKVIEKLCSEKCERFDLGIGEASYKYRFCQNPIRLKDIYLGLTPAGKIYATALSLRCTLKFIYIRVFNVSKNFRSLS
jgi:CelD/BcsL family acetyltransferase involved in cellulose biosynthesis